MLNKEDTIILIGRSDFLDSDLCKNFYYCTEIYNCATINWACTKYYSKYCFFLDSYVWKMCHNKVFGKPKLITSTVNIGLVQGWDYEIYDQHRMYTSMQPYTKETLLGAGFTHDYAISYLIKEGYKNIILAGCADFVTKEYAKGMNVRTDVKWNYSDKCKINSEYLINNVLSKHTHIYTLNPDSELKVDRISVDELL